MYIYIYIYTHIVLGAQEGRAAVAGPDRHEAPDDVGEVQEEGYTCYC